MYPGAATTSQTPRKSQQHRDDSGPSSHELGNPIPKSMLKYT